MASISTDGTCGSNSDTNSPCLGSTYGNCCSTKGFCGSTSAYCGAGCQSAFGNCTSDNSESISTTGSCGATGNNYTCLGSTFGDCCSALGYCGGNSSYCGDGCQSAFGSCGSVSSSSSIISTTTTAATTGTSSATISTATGTVSIDGNCGSNSDVLATCVGSQWGNCCSSHGFCGGNANYCSTGCQSQFGKCGLDAMTTNITSTSGSPSGNFSKGAIAGISVGAAIGGLAVIGLLVWFAFSRMEKKMANSNQSEEELKQFPPSKSFASLQELDALGNTKHEIGGPGHDKDLVNVRSPATRQELDNRMISELPA